MKATIGVNNINNNIDSFLCIDALITVSPINF